MNTTMYDLAIDERFEGEDAADALFASMLLEPPKWLDERILSIARDAIIDREEKEFLRLEQLSDAMFAGLMIAPPAYLDQRITEMARNRFLFKDLWGKIVDIIIELFSDPEPVIAYSAADDEEQTDLELLLRRPEGDCTLYTTVDQEDPSHRSVMLFFDGESYEGKEVLLTKDHTVILHGTIKYGQIEAPLPVGVKIEPPFDLRFR